MKILQVSIADQTVSILPRSFPAGDVTMVLRRENTNTSQSLIITPVVSGAYLELTRVYPDLFENEYFSFDVLDGTNLIYRDKIFVTDQVLDKYTIHEGEFIEDTTKKNQYIFDE